MNAIEKKLFFILCVLATFLCAGCSGDDSVVAKYTEDGKKYSPVALSGSIDYLASMTPDEVKVVRLDNKFKAVDTLYATVEYGYYGKLSIRLEENDYLSPFLKVSMVFDRDDGSGEMVFDQFVDLSLQTTGSLSLSLVDALVSGRIEHLVKDKAYGFSEAKEQAYAELSKMFGVEKIGTDEVFVYCKHQVSDSVFYATYKDLRKILKNGDTLSTSKRVDIADAFLDAFEVLPGYDFFKNVSRDSSLSLLYTFYYEIFEWGYGIKGFDAQASNGDTLVIHQKSSKYKGRYFVYDFRGSTLSGYTYLWRINSDMEDTLGICLNATDTFVRYDERYYRCAKSSCAWELLETSQDALPTVFGGCWDGGRWGVFNDSIFSCECPSESPSECAWEFKGIDKGVDTSDVDYPKYLDAWATALYGSCKTNNANAGEKRQVDSVMVRCQSNAWSQIDSVMYYLGGCTGYDVNDNVVEKLPNGNSYICSSTYMGSEWKRMLGDEYDGEECTEEILDEEIEFEGKTFACTRSAEFEQLEEQVWLQGDFIYYWRER